MDELSTNLARTVRRLREERGLSQRQMAKIAAIPRPTWASLESGGANPTLAVLAKVASAFQISIEELVGPPRSTCQFYPVGHVRGRKRGDATIRSLVPELLPGQEIVRIDLPAGGVMRGVPHTRGTSEYLTCETGQMELSLTSGRWTLRPGDALAFRGDQRHSYRNPGRTRALAFSIVAFGASASR